METNYPDLTQRPPRSPRVRLGGFVTLPRILDKCRAVIAGTNGEYNYDCPMDQNFLNFAGIKADDLKEQVATGKGDGEILAWVQENMRSGLTEADISNWSSFAEPRCPSDVESREFYQGIHSQVAPDREDIASWFDLLDLDDYVSFGGKP